MDLDEFFDREMEALEKQLRNGEISQRQFNVEVVELRRDVNEQEEIQAIRDAGRGHLLR